MRISLSFFVLSAALTLVGGENLLKNPDFQKLENGFPAHWRYLRDGLAAPEPVMFRGRPALRIDDRDPGKGSGLRQDVPCEPGAKYELSCTAYPLGPRPIGQVQIQAAGRNLTLLSGRNVLGITADPDRKMFRVYVWTSRSSVGSAYVMDLRLEKVTKFGKDTVVDGVRLPARGTP